MYLNGRSTLDDLYDSMPELTIDEAVQKLAYRVNRELLKSLGAPPAIIGTPVPSDYVVDVEAADTEPAEFICKYNIANNALTFPISWKLGAGLAAEQALALPATPHPLSDTSPVMVPESPEKPRANRLGQPYRLLGHDEVE